MHKVFGSWCGVEVKLWKLYEEGQTRLEKEFDLAKIVVKLRNLNVFIKNKLLDNVGKLELINCYKTVIDLDTNDDITK